MGLREWWRERQRVAQLHLECARWMTENYYCKECDGSGWVEMFVDPGYRALNNVECWKCIGTGVRPGAPSIPPRFWELFQ